MTNEKAMNAYQYPQAVYLVDVSKRDDSMPLCLNLIGEADVEREIDGIKETSKVILALEGQKWYSIDFIKNNYK